MHRTLFLMSGFVCCTWPIWSWHCMIWRRLFSCTWVMCAISSITIVSPLLVRLCILFCFVLLLVFTLIGLELRIRVWLGLRIWVLLVVPVVSLVACVLSFEWVFHLRIEFFRVLIWTHQWILKICNLKVNIISHLKTINSLLSIILQFL